MSFFQLKLLAVITMVIDHIGAFIFPECNILRDIGRLAFPIFAFCIANGYKYTRDKLKYALRLFICALLSIVPLNLVSPFQEPYTSNIFFTLLLGLIAIYFYEQIKIQRKGYRICISFGYAIAMMICLSLGNTLEVQYGLWGVLLILFYHIVMESKVGIVMTTVIGNFIMSTNNDQLNSSFVSGRASDFSIKNISNIIDVNYYIDKFTSIKRIGDVNSQWMGAFCAIPLFLYNGKKGYSAKWVQYAFYLFYPVHLLVIRLFI